MCVCVLPSSRKKFLSINTARPLEEGHVQRQARWKKAKSEDLLTMRRQDTTQHHTARPLEEGHVQRQAQWKKAKSEDLLATRRQDTTRLVTVRRPLE